MEFSLTPRELRDKLGRQETIDDLEIVLLDVRQPEERAVCSLGGIFLPLGELSQRYPELPQDKAIVVYCHHGVRSANACAFLRSHGFTARNLSGGIDRWSEDVDKSVARY